MRFTIEIPDDIPNLSLPTGVQRRLITLLDRQDRGQTLSSHEREEAEGLVSIAELLSLLKLRAERLGVGADDK